MDSIGLRKSNQDLPDSTGQINQYEAEGQGETGSRSNRSSGGTSPNSSVSNLTSVGANGSGNLAPLAEE